MVYNESDARFADQCTVMINAGFNTAGGVSVNQRGDKTIFIQAFYGNIENFKEADCEGNDINIDDDEQQELMGLLNGKEADE